MYVCYVKIETIRRWFDLYFTCIKLRDWTKSQHATLRTRTIDLLGHLLGYRLKMGINVRRWGRGHCIWANVADGGGKTVGQTRFISIHPCVRLSSIFEETPGPSFVSISAVTWAFITELLDLWKTPIRPLQNTHRNYSSPPSNNHQTNPREGAAIKTFRVCVYWISGTGSMVFQHIFMHVYPFITFEWWNQEIRPCTDAPKQQSMPSPPHPTAHTQLPTPNNPHPTTNIPSTHPTTHTQPPAPHPTTQTPITQNPSPSAYFNESAMDNWVSGKLQVSTKSFI